MKSKQFSKAALTCLVLGLMVIAAVQILARCIPLSDFAHGSLMGFGIGLEWMAFIFVVRSKRKANSMDNDMHLFS